MTGFRQTFDFRQSPTAFAYATDLAQVSVAVGPVGSGKTYASLVKPHLIADKQEPSPDNVRRTRFAIVRNTMPELRSTTMATYEAMYPPDRCGRIIQSTPARHVVKRLPARDGSRAGMEVEFWFLALDKPADIKKLLSLEVTGMYFNEVREIPKVILSRATERIGRFKIDERPTTWRGIWGDTNPPDSDHYLYAWDKEERPAGFNFHHQPPGVLEVEKANGRARIIDPNFPGMHGLELDRAEVNGRDCEVEFIPAAGRLWIVNPWAENLGNLARVSPTKNPLGPESYYGSALAGKDLAEIRVYLQGVYEFVQDGKPVIPEYRDEIMGIEDLPVLDDVPLILGLDIGGGTLQPSAVIAQRHPRGTWLIHSEVVCYDLGIDTFGALLSQHLADHYPRHVESFDRLVGTAWGDPAGVKRDELYEVASFDHLRRKYGFDARPAPSQDIRVRINAIKTPCGRLIDGKPGLLVNKRRCKVLRKGLMGAWCFKRLQVTGEARFRETPSKNEYSHPCDALGYLLSGGGEAAQLRGRAAGRRPPARAIIDVEV